VIRSYKRGACGHSRDGPGVAIQARQLGGRRCELAGAGTCGALRGEAGQQLGKKEGASRTELQQDSRVSSPVPDTTRVREIGKTDE